MTNVSDHSALESGIGAQARELWQCVAPGRERPRRGTTAAKSASVASRFPSVHVHYDGGAPSEQAYVALTTSYRCLAKSAGRYW